MPLQKIDGDQLELFERVIRVYAACIREWIDEKTVEFIDVSETIEGYDRMLFTCPHCGKQHHSLRRG